MLVISRTEGESISISIPEAEIRLTIKAIYSGGQVKLSIDAPEVVEILREELIGPQKYQE
jgi:carbon storage regulator CsrA